MVAGSWGPGLLLPPQPGSQGATAVVPAHASQSRREGGRAGAWSSAAVVGADVWEVLLDGNMMGEADGDLLGDGRWGL